MQSIPYKKGSHFKRQINILKDDLNLGSYIDETTKECLSLIEKYRIMVIQDNYESYTALKSIKNFLFQNYELINPIIYIKTEFLDQSIENFISSDIGAKNLFISIIEILTNHEIICDYIVNDNDLDFMSKCADLISKEANVNISAQYINILIHLLPSFFKFDHDDSELYIDKISTSSAHLLVIKFMSRLISRSSTISAPQHYIEILYDKFQHLTDGVDNLAIDEDVFIYIFQCFTNISNRDITNNAYILDKTKNYNIPIFENVMRFFDADTYMDSQKVMDSLFGYIISVFGHRSVEKYKYEKILFSITKDFEFYIYIIQKSQNASIRKNALKCMYTVVNLESLQDEQEIIDFLNDMSLFEFLVDIFKNGSTSERDMAFNIIMKKIGHIKPSQENIEFIYDLDFLDDIKDFINIEIEKSTYYYVYILYYMNRISRGEEVASRINELNIFDEIDNYLMTEQITDEARENILDATRLLKMLMDSTLEEEDQL